jgi:hemerythrin
MDRDHAALERMFVEAREKPDSERLSCFDAIAQEIGDHFAREETAMTEARFRSSFDTRR